MSIYDRDWYRESYNNHVSNSNITRIPKKHSEFFRWVIWLILLAYIFEIYRYADINNALFFRESYQFDYYYHIKRIVTNPYSVNLVTIVTLIAIMIPIGYLFPLAKQMRCQNGTLIFGELLIVVIDIIKFISERGIVCFENLLLGLIGTYIGYKLFVKISIKSNYGYFYLSHGNSDKKKGWAGVLIILILFESIFWNVNVGNLNGVAIEYKSADGDNLISENKKDDEYEQRVLTDAEYVYQTMYEQISAYNTYIKVYSVMRRQITSEDIKEQLDKIILDNPDIFWLTGAANGMVRNDGFSSTYSYNLGTFCDIKNVPDMKKELDSVVDQIVLKANQYSTDYEKALYVHDVLVDLCEYDTSGYVMSQFYDNNYKDTMTYSAYGCLVEHKAVCSGYAKAYQLIMNKLGIECGFVGGIGTNSMGSGSHAWNYIKIDGNYYYVDVTWDDPLVFGYKTGEISHEYFCVTKAEISKDHTFDEGQYAPN